MKRKTDKVEEAAGIYQVKPAKAVEPKKNTDEAIAKGADDAAFDKIVDKIFTERKELLHKLAQ